LSPNNWVRVGQIVSTFGLKGQVKVMPLTDFIDRFEPGSRLRLNGNWITVEESSWHKNQVILRLEGVRHIAIAEELRGAYLEVQADTKPQLEEDEYLTADLIGLRVLTTKGELLGIVDEVQPSPAHDLLIVGKTMIPAVKQFVKKVDIPGGFIEVELIEGMLEE
jgi:16S rRNA processing protein RimM